MVQCFTPDRRKKNFTLQIRSHSKCLRKKPWESKLYICSYVYLRMHTPTSECSVLCGLNYLSIEYKHTRNMNRADFPALGLAHQYMQGFQVCFFQPSAA